MKPATVADVRRLLNKYSYGQWNNANLGEWAQGFDTYPDFLAHVLFDHFLIQKREIKPRYD